MNRQREYHKEYYQRPDIKKRQRKYHKEYRKEYYQRPEIKKRQREYMREYNQLLRKRFLELYGSKCACCGESDERFLTLDHKNGYGKADRRQRGQLTILREAINNPCSKKYQILCFNCNCGTPNEEVVLPNQPPLSKSARARRNLRERLFEVYGSVCACCGESEKRFLTFDHKLNNGAEDRRGSGFKSIRIWRKALSNPDHEQYQILCFNCNCGRSVNNGVCPHKESASL